MRLVSCSLLSPLCFLFFFLMIRRPPRSTLDRSSAASDVYKRQREYFPRGAEFSAPKGGLFLWVKLEEGLAIDEVFQPVSYTHLRAHETVLDLVCRLLLEKKKKKTRKEDMSLESGENKEWHN